MRIAWLGILLELTEGDSKNRQLPTNGLFQQTTGGYQMTWWNAWRMLRFRFMLAIF